MRFCRLHRGRYVHWDVLEVVGGTNNLVLWFTPNVPAADRNGMF